MIINLFKKSAHKCTMNYKLGLITRVKIEWTDGCGDLSNLIQVFLFEQFKLSFYLNNKLGFLWIHSEEAKSLKFTILNNSLFFISFS